MQLILAKIIAWSAFRQNLQNSPEFFGKAPFLSTWVRHSVLGELEKYHSITMQVLHLHLGKGRERVIQWITLHPGKGAALWYSDHRTGASSVYQNTAGPNGDPLCFNEITKDSRTPT